jgi:hypothetical protein
LGKHLKIDSTEAKIESLPALFVRRHAPLNLSPCREEEDSSRESVRAGESARVTAAATATACSNPSRVCAAE